MPLAGSQNLNVVGFSGNLHRPSKTRKLVETVIEHIAARRGDESVDASVFDLVDVMPELGQAMDGSDLPPKLENVIDRLAKADAVVVGSPVYKGSYTGLFKHFFDLIEPQRLAGLPVVLTANGGGDRHALMVEHQLRPLFGFFSSHTIATSIYASERDFTDGRIQSEPLLQRIEAAVSDLSIWLERNDHFKLSRIAS
jgi:FMN reductase